MGSSGEITSLIVPLLLLVRQRSAETASRGARRTCGFADLSTVVSHCSRFSPSSAVSFDSVGEFDIRA
jgi:hypothetical protein